MIRLLLVICLVLSSSYAQNSLIDDTSPSWNYNPPVCQDFCDGTQPGIQQSWWQLANQWNSSAMQGFFDLTETATNLIGATATLNFRGIAIYYYGNVAPWGGVMAITLDGSTTNINTINSGPEHHQTLVYSQTGLNGSQQHTLIVKMISGTYIDVDRVDITPPPTSSSSSTSTSTSTSTSISSSTSTSLSNSLPPSSSTTLPTSSNSASIFVPASTTTGTTQSVTTTTGQPNIGVIVGSIVAAAVALGLCIFLGAWWIRHRRPKLDAQLIAIYPQDMTEQIIPTSRVQPEGCDNILDATAFLTPQPDDALLGEHENLNLAVPPPYTDV